MAKKKKAAKKKTAQKKRAAKGWKPAEVALLKKLFSNNPTSQIAKQLRRKTDAVKRKASRMGLRKAKKYMRKLGRA